MADLDPSLVGKPHSMFTIFRKIETLRLKSSRRYDELVNLSENTGEEPHPQEIF